MKMSRVMTALALIAAIVVSVVGIFLLATSGALAAPAQVKPSSDGYGYGHHSATPSRTRVKMTVSATPTSELPQTGDSTRGLAFVGLSSLATGILLVVAWWVWHAFTRDRHRAAQRHALRLP